MAKVSGCLCWPKMLQGKRKDPQKENSSQFSAQNSTLDPTGDRRRQSIPKEHDDFIEMLFRPGRHRSRTLTTSLFSPPKRRSDAAGSIGGGGPGWFRRRTNSLLSAKRYSMEEDLQLFETVPATPGAAFQREFSSFTLPLRWNNDDGGGDDDDSTGPPDVGARGGRGRAARRTDVWPEYIWRLNQKRQQQRCLCAGCEDASATSAACARVYRHPVRHTDDEDDDGSPQSKERGLDRRGARGYDRPKSKGGDVCVGAEPYDVVPALPGSSGWMSCGRRSLRDRAGEWRTDSTEFLARPRSASLEQRALRTAAAKGRAARGEGGGRGGRRGGEDASDFPVCSWRGWCGHQGQNQQQHYDRPVGLYPSRPTPPPGHRRGCHGMMTRSSFGVRCFACELKLETMSEEWNRMEDYYPREGGSLRSRRSYDGGDSGYMQSDQEIGAQVQGAPGGGGTSRNLEFNYVIPSGMSVERKRTVCCHDDDDDDDDDGDDAESDDYLTPLSEKFKRFQFERDQPERYLAMNSGASMRDRNETFASEKIERKNQRMTTKVPPSDDDIERKQENESCDEITSAEKCLVSADKCESDQNPEESSIASGKSVHDPVENGPDGKKMADDSGEKISILVDKEETNESKNSTIEVTETPGFDATSPPSNDKEPTVAGSVSLKETAGAPPVVTRARSHLDVLHMSPPPQCSFMVDHSYMNITDPGNEKSLPSFKNEGNKEQNVPKNMDSIEEAAEEIYFAAKSKAGNEYLAHWQDVARLNKQPPGSQYVVLHKKTSAGNNYCHTYLPTLRENLRNSCKSK